MSTDKYNESYAKKQIENRECLHMVKKTLYIIWRYTALAVIIFLLRWYCWTNGCKFSGCCTAYTV